MNVYQGRNNVVNYSTFIKQRTIQSFERMRLRDYLLKRKKNKIYVYMLELER